MEQLDSTLRYIDAEHVDTPVGRLGGTIVVSASDEAVGALEGMVIDPVERRVRYFVVRSGSWLATHRHLIPATPAQLDGEHKRLHVDIEPAELSRLRQVRSNTFQQFSDDDLIAALFSPHAA